MAKVTTEKETYLKGLEVIKEMVEKDSFGKPQELDTGEIFNSVLIHCRNLVNITAQHGSSALDVINHETQYLLYDLLLAYSAKKDTN